MRDEAGLSEAELAKLARRIGLGPEALAPSRHGTVDLLDELVRAFLFTVPFEQLDVALGRGINPSPDAAYCKLVEQGRGGYCFENNRVMHSALLSLGFEAQLHVGRVVISRVGSNTHLVNTVTTRDGARYLVDVGFGGYSARRALPLARLGEAILAYPDAFRIVPDHGKYDCEGALRVQYFDPRLWQEAGRPAAGSAGAEACWRDHYTYHPARPTFQSDIELGNYWVSTRGEGNWFANTRLAIVATVRGRKVLQATSLVRLERVHDADLVAQFGRAAVASQKAAASPALLDPSLHDGGHHDRDDHDGDDAAHADQDEAAVAPVGREAREFAEAAWLGTLAAEFGLDLRWDHRTGQVVAADALEFTARSLDPTVFL
mmetsp:Transcript_13723/g.38975  ORF Transcript_13723/g.38975 Transcript_13723/m.38975 type:complete len:375 (-) Transcript_13723:105-1229(-)